MFVHQVVMSKDDGRKVSLASLALSSLSKVLVGHCENWCGGIQAGV
jgi:hypothetical protein